MLGPGGFVTLYLVDLTRNLTSLCYILWSMLLPLPQSKLLQQVYLLIKPGQLRELGDEYGLLFSCS